MSDILETKNLLLKYDISQDELDELQLLFENQNDIDSLELFIKEYMINPGLIYNDEIVKYLRECGGEALPQSEVNNKIRAVSTLSLVILSLLVGNFKKFSVLYSDFLFKNLKIKNNELKRSILKQVIDNFEQTISGSILNTQLFITNAIRTLQKEIISNNFLLKKNKITESLVQKEKNLFLKRMMKRYPKISNAINKGNVISIVKDNLTRHYKVDYYIDFCVRNTLYNAQRETTELIAKSENDLVVEYYWHDKRPAKKDREICQEILDTKVFGKSLLALDGETANKLGIMTVEQAKSTYDYAMGPNCRHFIRRLDESFLGKIRSFIK